MPVIRVANSSQPEVFIVTVGVELRVREKGRPRGQPGVCRENARRPEKVQATGSEIFTNRNYRFD
jgi:hypothetical protein